MQTFKKKFSISVSILLLSILFLTVSAQVQPDLYQQVHPDIHLDVPGSRVDCERVTLQGINYIRNNEFKHDALSNVTDPFPTGDIPYWVETHGSPALSDFLIPPSNAPAGIYSYASMYSWAGSEKDVLGEGIAQVIPVTIPDKQYSLSFFKKLAGNTKDLKSNMDKFYIVLLHCGDYERIHKYPLYEIPRIPNDAQIIYSESNLNNPDWMQIQSAFTARGEYDMVWIFPVQSNNVKDLLAVDFTGMVLKETYIDGDFHCDQPLSLTGCNHIPNPGFTLNVPMTPFLIGAFSQNWVTDWNDSHGTCDINREINLPPLPLGNYASMGLTGAFFNGQQLYSYEGIAAKIMPVQQGRKYALSFFVATNYFGNPIQNGGFNIALINCQNFPNANSSYDLPPLSVPNQPIYCESVPIADNTGWKRVFVSFEATGNYDMIRIYPDQSQPGFDDHSFFNFSYPELIDITDFNAGPTPVPNPSDCHVTIGPGNAPQCSVVGTSFSWHSPNGQVVGPLFTGLQYELDASDPLNVGTWTLTMDVPNGVQTNNICSANITSVSVDVPSCVSVWPKVYSYVENTGALSLLKDNANNLFMTFSGESLQSINHIGPLPTSTIGLEAITFHYTGAGITNWFRQDPFASSKKSIRLQSGHIQTYEPDFPGTNTNYYSCINGNTSSPPANIPVTENIIAETNAGLFITESINSINNVHSLNVHSGITTTSTVISTAPYTSGFISKFNPVTNKLFLFIRRYIPSQPDEFIFRVYQLTGNTLSLVVENTSPNYAPYRCVQIDNNDNVYVLKDNKVQVYDYFTYTYTVLNIPGFNNNSIKSFASDNPYTEDRCLLFNSSDEKIYSIDLSALNSKKIQTSNFLPVLGIRYAYDGNNVFITGFNRILSAPTNIGIQSIPSPDHSLFFTKLSLQTDFNFREESPVNYFSRSGNGSLQRLVTAKKSIDDTRLGFTIKLSPNPVKDILHINIFSNKTTYYNITIVNSQGKVVLQQKIDQKTGNISVSNLNTGVYYTITCDSDGNKSSGTFIKL